MQFFLSSSKVWITRHGSIKLPSHSDSAHNNKRQQMVGTFRVLKVIHTHKQFSLMVYPHFAARCCVCVSECVLLSWSNYAFCFWSCRTYSFSNCIFLSVLNVTQRVILHVMRWMPLKVYFNARCAHAEVSSIINFHCTFISIYESDHFKGEERNAAVTVFFSPHLFIYISRYSILKRTCTTFVLRICVSGWNVWMGLLGEEKSANDASPLEKYLSIWCLCGCVAM